MLLLLLLSTLKIPQYLPPSQVQITHLQNDLAKYAGWGLPVAVGAAWMIFPAVPDHYKGILAPEKVVTNAPHYKWDELDNMPVVKG